MTTNSTTTGKTLLYVNRHGAQSHENTMDCVQHQKKPSRYLCRRLFLALGKELLEGKLILPGTEKEASRIMLQLFHGDAIWQSVMMRYSGLLGGLNTDLDLVKDKHRQIQRIVPCKSFFLCRSQKKSRRAFRVAVDLQDSLFLFGLNKSFTASVKLVCVS